MNFWRGLAGFLLVAILPVFIALHMFGVITPGVAIFQSDLLPLLNGTPLSHVFYGIFAAFFVVGLFLLCSGNSTCDKNTKG
ncbi:MAG: hypothetical protein Q8R36_04280 [bacterium]|nr:hypothetical protein [bacterium]